MRREIAALLSGALFGVGLLVSGMTKPSKVIGFLDFAGTWDASLAFVIGGGVLIHLVLYRLITKRSSPLLEARFQIPTRKDIDRKLVVGAGLFGIGWGLGGYCPGPGLTSIAQGGTALGFVGAMIVGMYVHDLAANALPGKVTPQPTPQKAV
jgi:uncharacterized membrane protein YedE/YeeE